MKPFSLDEYNKNKDLPIVTRDGKSVRIVSTKMGQNRPICAIVESSCGTAILGTEMAMFYDDKGRCHKTPEEYRGFDNFFNSGYDLFFDVDEPKPCTLKPFDKVLVRDWYNDKWHPGFFRNVDYDEKGTSWFIDLNCGSWKQCIPYNEETAGLISTDNPAPSKYVIW